MEKRRGNPKRHRIGGFNYDIGWFYVNLAYATKVNQPSSFSDSSAKVNAILLKWWPTRIRIK